MNDLKNDSRFLTSLSKNIGKHIGRKLTTQENIYVLDIIGNIDFTGTEKFSITDIIQTLSKGLYNKILKINNSKFFKEINYDKNTNNRNDSNNQNTNSRNDIIDTEYDMHTYHVNVLNANKTADDPDNIIDTVNKIDNINNNVISNNKDNTDDNKDSSIVANLTTIFNLVDLTGIRRTFNPKSRILKEYIIFDSRYRSLSASTNTKFQWKYSDSPYANNGVVNTIKTVRNLIAMKMCQASFPNIPNMDISSGKIAILFQEFLASSFIASSNINYNLLLRRTPLAGANYVYGTIYVLLQTEDYQDGIIKFRQPITELNTFTMSFSDPLNPIIFPPDRSMVNFIYGNPTTIITPLPNNLINNSTVFITDFTTTNVYNDASVIAAMNNPNGLIISTIDTTTFTVPVDTSSLSGAILDLSVECYFAQYRFIFPFELAYLSD